MVKYLIALALLLPLLLFGQEANITAQIDDNQGYAGQPLNGTIAVTHAPKDQVDPLSFTMADKPLKVEFIRDVPVSSTLTITYYKFTLPPEEKGLKALQSITATVGGAPYNSIPTTYEVKAAAPPPKAEPGAPAPVLELHARAEVPNPFYPGQRGKLINEILFTENITLSKENLPLLEAKGMNKIGETQAEVFQQQNKTVQRLTQLVKADKPGEYTYGPSTIEGQPFRLDYAGKKVYLGMTLKADAPVIKVEVKPFPEKGKPAAFQGAVGNYKLNVALLTSPHASVGDTMKLAVAISGDGDLDAIAVPKIICQPGWSGLFAIDDLPPEVQTEGNKRTFTIDIRPLTPHVKEIPPVLFSFFDPKKGDYTSLKSAPIPIQIEALKTKEEAAPPVNEKEFAPEKPPVEILGNKPLNTWQNTPFTSWKALWIVPIGILLLLLQYLLRRYLLQKPKTAPTSRALFEQALAEPPESTDFYQKLQKALLVRLFERGEISSAAISVDEIPQTGFAKEVRLFLQKLEKLRYTAGKKEAADALKKEAEDLFNLLEKND